MPTEPIERLAWRLHRDRTANGHLEARLDRIAEDDHRWHAMLALDPAAHDEARTCDRMKQPAGPLHGVPIVVKDNIDLAGLPTTSGCIGLARAMPADDAAVVARLRAAGAVMLGKTNLSEFSFEIRSRSSIGGDVLCPFDPSSTAGGSSGGSAVAVARGYAAAALGTDTGGSIRIPAAINGLVGFRPAHASLPMRGIAPLAPSTDTVGPIAVCVADTCVLYRAMGGQMAAEDAAPARIGVLQQAFGADSRIHAAMDASCARLRHAGHTLVENFAVDGIEDWLSGPHIVDIEFATAFDAYLAEHFEPGTAPRNLRQLFESKQYLPDYTADLQRRMAADPQDAAAVLRRHAGMTRALRQAMKAAQVDAVLYPSLRIIPDSLDNPAGGWAAELAARTGWPAITVPVLAPGALRPVGVELMLPSGAEARLFALARQIESA